MGKGRSKKQAVVQDKVQEQLVVDSAPSEYEPELKGKVDKDEQVKSTNLQSGKLQGKKVTNGDAVKTNLIIETDKVTLKECHIGLGMIRVDHIIEVNSASGSEEEPVARRGRHILGRLKNHSSFSNNSSAKSSKKRKRKSTASSEDDHSSNNEDQDEFEKSGDDDYSSDTEDGGTRPAIASKRKGRPCGSSKANPDYTPKYKQKCNEEEKLSASGKTIGRPRGSSAKLTANYIPKPKYPKIGNKIKASSKTKNCKDIKSDEIGSEVKDKKIKYERRIHPYDNSLLYLKSKYLRWKKIWKDSTSSFHKFTPPDVKIPNVNLLLELFRNITYSTLSNYCNSVQISIDSFACIDVEDINEQTKLTLQPFTGQIFFKNYEKIWSPPNTLLEGLDIVINTTAPITSFTLSSLNHINSNNYKKIFFIIGTTRIGWPKKINDYEMLIKNRIEFSELNQMLGKENNFYPTVTGNYGVGNDYPRTICSNESHENLLQIWQICKKENYLKESFDKSNQNVHNISLAYFVALENRGSVKKVIWSDLKSTDSNVVGIIAIVTGSGECVVLGLPEKLPNGDQICEENIQSFDQLPVISESSIRLCVIHHKLLQILSISWGVSNPFEIMCGMSDGSIVIYSIRSCLERKNGNTQQVIRLIESDIDLRSPATCGAVCVGVSSFDPKLIACGHLDGTIMIWNTDEPECPIFSKKLNSIGNLKWDESGLGVYLCDPDNSIVYWEPLIQHCLESSIKRFSLYSHENKSGAVWDIACVQLDENSFVASVGSDGNVRCGFTSLLGMIKENGEGLMNIFKLNVEPPFIESTSTSSSSSSSSSSVLNSNTVFKLNRKPSNVEILTPLEKWSLNNALYLKTIDAKQIKESAELEFVLLAYGGDGGIGRIHSFHPQKTLVAVPVE